jgi:trehalose 6-phosphate synthase
VSGDDLVIVANRLPLEAVTSADGTVSWNVSPGGLVAAVEPAMRGRAGGTWIGWNGHYQGGDEAQLPQIPVEDPGRDYKVVEVQLEREDVELYYDGFSNSSLWPLYHDCIVTPSYHRHHFEAYRRVNMMFARAAARAAETGATVWIHDYQLQLVPAMLRSLRPDVRIGFFLHIPFPAPDLFLQLPWRRNIVLGILGADLVGFQTTGGARNFLHVTERLLGWPTNGDVIEVPGAHGGRRQARVGAFGVSVDATRIDSIARRAETAERVKQLRHDLGNPKTMLLGVDRLDYTKGIDVRMRAYTELLLEKRLEPGETVLVQVATPSRENVNEYQKIRDDVELIVGHTNGELGQIGAPAIHYVRNSLPLEELVALYQAANIMLVTPLRDGMNLVCKEYVASRIDNDGALVLSEFTGAARELPQSWLVNPYDADGLKEAVVAAVEAPIEERQRRMKAMRAHIHQHDVQRWARTFLAQLAASDLSAERNTERNRA